jgi:predicted dehydrogenase
MACLRFAVLGCGSIGKRHIRNLQALAAGQIVAFDPRPDCRREVTTQFGIPVVDTLGKVWDRYPDVALITAPTSLHVSLALQAAQHGCHLFIEKPLSDRLDDVDALLRLVSARGLVTLVGCNLRFHPGLKTVKQLLADNAAGRVISARAEFGYYLPNWHPWEDYRQTYSARRDLGGGVILDAIHEIDYLQWMLGEVEAVVCFSGKLSSLDIDTEDTAALVLRFASGALGEVHLDYVQRSYTRQCHIVGEDGTIRWDYVGGEVRWYSAATHQWRVFANPFGWETEQMYRDEMRHFLQCLAGKEGAAVDVFTAARVLKVALAAKTSAETGQVIHLTS